MPRSERDNRVVRLDLQRPPATAGGRAVDGGWHGPRNGRAGARSIINLVDGTGPAVAAQRPQVVLGDPGAGRIEPELASALITRIFAAGLHLSALQSLLGDGTLGARAAAVVEELDTVIRDIRAGALGRDDGWRDPA